MGRFHDDVVPGESAGYRAARDALLAAELDLRRQIEAVAAARRALPRGGAVREDYLFAEGAADLDDRDTVVATRFSELFAPGRDNLLVYSFMYAPGDDPCPMCTSMLDSLDGAAPHIGARINLAVVAKAPLADIRAWARGRGWRNLRLLSSHDNTYNADYKGERAPDAQIPTINTFERTPDGIFHHWASELFFAGAEDGQHPRHADLIWPVWASFDMTRAGRGTDWFPAYAYG